MLTNSSLAAAKALFCLFLCFAALSTPSISDAEEASASSSNNWYATCYVGQLTTNDLREFFQGSMDTVESYMFALAVGKEVWRYHDAMAIELEGQLAKYVGGYTFECNTPECMQLPPEKRARKKQDHAEINALVVLRWLDFPWDRYVDTSFAFGEGLSYATHVPAVEENLHFETFGFDNDTSNLLNYLMLELALAMPGSQSWSLVARIHHRSSVFGVLADSESGSNTLGLGLRYDFK